MRRMQRKLRGMRGQTMSALRIGVTVNRRQEDHSVHYVTEKMIYAVEASGGEVVPLDYPMKPEMLTPALASIDGLILSGGPDVHPRHFGEEIDPYCGEIIEERDELELFLAHWAVENDVPTLGVCRGMQVMNIALGGDIWQDIVHPLGLIHRQEDDVRYFHDIVLEGNGFFRKMIASERYPVNSYHHQAVRRLGAGLTAAACAPDGIVEAIEKKDARFFVGVQWHPEISFSADSFSRKIFDAFMAACRKA